MRREGKMEATNKLLTYESFEMLPELLKKFCRIGTGEDDRDLLLISLLGTLSGCLNNYGIYKGAKVYPTLFVIIIAKAGAGKGIMHLAKRVALAYDQDKRSKGEARLLIPGNSSSAAIYAALERSEGAGLIFESEIDTLSSVFTQDWGNLPDVIRNTFHHEAVSISRKGKEGFYHINIDLPRFAMVLSGTRRQLTPLIGSIENGLFSRLLFMVIHPKFIWHDVSPDGQTMDPNKVETIIGEFLTVLKYNDEHPFELLLNRDQWDELNEHFGYLLREEAAAIPELDATIKRLGLIMFRICMILTSIRRAELGATSPTQVCTEADFSIALELTKNLFENAVKVYGLYKDSQTRPLRRSLVRLLDALPDSFTTAKALEIAGTFNLGERITYKYLKELTPEYLSWDGKGHYTKQARGSTES